MEKICKIDISAWTIVKIFLAILLFWIIIQIKEILLLVFILMIIVTAVEPFIKWQEENNIPRSLAVIITFLLLLSLLFLAFYLIIPPLVNQVGKLVVLLPSHLQSFTQKFDFVYQYVANSQSQWQQWLQSVYNQLSFISGGIYNAILTIFGGVTTAATLLILSIYSLLDKKNLNQFLLSFIPPKAHSQYISLTTKVSSKLGYWLRGQLLLGLVIGIIDLIGLYIIGIPYALTIAFIAGILEIIPILGPLISGTIAVLIALATTGWLKALIVLVFYIAVQQAENNYLAPKIMSKATGLSPVIIIIALLIGSKLGGIVGAILAIPITAVLITVFQEIKKNQFPDKKEITNE